jgi:hypothetical protein
MFCFYSTIGCMAKLKGRVGRERQAPAAPTIPETSILDVLGVSAAIVRPLTEETGHAAKAGFDDWRAQKGAQEISRIRGSVLLLAALTNITTGSARINEVKTALADRLPQSAHEPLSSGVRLGALALTARTQLVVGNIVNPRPKALDIELGAIDSITTDFDVRLAENEPAQPLCVGLAVLERSPRLAPPPLYTQVAYEGIGILHHNETGATVFTALQQS